jgi:hypothetical protein
MLGLEVGWAMLLLPSVYLHVDAVLRHTYPGDA